MQIVQMYQITSCTVLTNLQLQEICINLYSLVHLRVVGANFDAVLFVFAGEGFPDGPPSLTPPPPTPTPPGSPTMSGGTSGSGTLPAPYNKDFNMSMSNINKVFAGMSKLTMHKDWQMWYHHINSGINIII